ncbi:MAG: hypothetical protein JO031_10275 [Ktedonobacteraceae bacterium]|nr:hypothetical protein [Ktedonobacteraceae bacterium]
MSTQRTKAVIARQLSSQELANYFAPRPYPIWVWVAFASGVALFIIGSLLQNMIFIGLSILLGFIGILIMWRTKRSNPDDEQYDAWVKSQGRILYKRGLQALGITESQMSHSVLSILSYVLPGSLDADDYDEDVVQIKWGKDGRCRSSITVYTFIYPLARSFAIFKSDVNAFYPALHNELDEVYAYRHIISATTSKIRDTILLEEQEFPYQIEHFCLKISNGETIKLSATVKAKPAGSAASAPTIALPDTNFNWTLGKLRSMLQ